MAEMIPVGNTIQAPQPINPLQSLSGILGIKQQQQNLQTGQYIQQQEAGQAQQQQQAMQERQAIQQMMKSGVDDKGNNIKGANGEPDPAKILPALGRIAPLTGQAYAQSILKTATDKVGLQSASTILDANQRNMLGGVIQAGSLSGAKAADINAGIDNLVQAHPEMDNAATYAKGLVGHLDSVQDPDKRKQVANQISSYLQGAEPVVTQPARATVDSGPNIQQGAVAPPASGGGFTPATTVTKNPGPTETYPYKEAAAAATARGAGLAAGSVGDVNTHYQAVQAEAQKAEAFTGIARNVQEFADTAITGTPEEKLNLMNGMLAYMGIPGTPDIKKASDLLEKNMSQLNLQGNVASDMRSMMTQMAQPHMTMSEDAIKEAAGQLIGQAQMKKAIGMAMTPEYNHAVASGDTTLYRAKRDAITNIADPRVWEFNSLSPKDRKAFRMRLSPQDNAALGQKYKAANALGLLQ